MESSKERRASLQPPWIGLLSNGAHYISKTIVFTIIVLSWTESDDM